MNEIEHSSIVNALFSCESMALRVKRSLKLGGSIEAINKLGSIIDLNADSRKIFPLASFARRLPGGTFRFRGGAAAPEFAAVSLRLSDAPPLPASSRFSLRFSLRISHAQLPAAITDARASHLASRRTEFISVSGSRPERTALHSDSRLKRLSGYVAAPELPHAPMNSPAAFRAGFPSQLFAN